MTNTTETILIVDDEPIVRELLEAYLARPGYQFIFASNGEEAIAKAAEFTPDLLLLDIKMPGMDGFEVCQHLKGNPVWQAIPIILVTSAGLQDDIVRGYNVGADDFLHKPIKGVELRTRVRSLLRLKRYYDDLAATLSFREDLANMVVHDMRTPLAVILGTTQRMQRKYSGTSPEVDKAGDTVVKQVRRLESFMNDLLLMAKLEGDKLALAPSEVNIHHLLREAGQNQEAIAHSKQIDIVFDLPAQPQTCWIDHALFQRVLDNLISNAIKYSPSQSTVTLRVEATNIGSNLAANGRQATNGDHPPAARISVIDEGPGIPEAHRDHIFDKFQIVNLRQHGVPQVGLGLAFCKMVVNAHGGQISVMPNHPTGSNFIIEV